MTKKSLESARRLGSRHTETGAPLAGSDFYPTPPEAVEALLKWEQFEGTIWEPACGDGAISKILTQHGYEVLSTDLNNHGFGMVARDFLMEWQTQSSNIITNPPYTLAEQFARKAIDLTGPRGKVAFLVRLQWLAGVSRRNLWETSPVKRFLIFSKRLPRMHRDGYDGPKSTSMVDFMWVIWDHEWTGGPPTVSWI